MAKNPVDPRVKALAKVRMGGNPLGDAVGAVSKIPGAAVRLGKAALKSGPMIASKAIAGPQAGGSRPSPYKGAARVANRTARTAGNAIAPSVRGTTGTGGGSAPQIPGSGGGGRPAPIPTGKKPIRNPAPGNAAQRKAVRQTDRANARAARRSGDAIEREPIRVRRGEAKKMYPIPGRRPAPSGGSRAVR